ncbi:MAG: HAD family acid phosphatase [Myxococcales bacterium]|nr:HAD family acid phosphatase [Myxococcales bacterium]
MASVLLDILDEVEARASGGLPVVVLDLDSTAISTARRQLTILREFADAHGDAELSAVVAEVSEGEMGFAVEGPLQTRGVDTEALKPQLRAFWRERFFADAYCRRDQPNPGAPAFARRVVERGGLVYYLTARPVDMMIGTVAVLQEHGFPLMRGRAVLHMKPSSHLDDHRFKRGAVAEIQSLRGVVCATFDNEPRHANAFVEYFPEAVNVLFGDVRSPDAPAPDRALVHIHTFQTSS